MGKLMRWGDCDEHGMHGIFAGDRASSFCKLGSSTGGGSEGFVCSNTPRKVNLLDRCLCCKVGISTGIKLVKDGLGRILGLQGATYDQRGGEIVPAFHRRDGRRR
jgi:hypothetical protein